MSKKGTKKGLLWLFFLLFVAASFVWYFKYRQQTFDYAKAQFNPGGLEEVEQNYGEQIELAAKNFNLSPHYLKALCMLECSGRKYIKPRFEPHIFEKLKLVKSGELKKFEHVTQKMLFDASDEALKNLASSWGPFQLMGYKCLLLDIKIADIRSDEAVYWGVKWIDETYGNFVRKEKYKDAFHMHNTGKTFPKSGISKTHDPEYVKNGLKYMEYFKKKTP